MATVLFVHGTGVRQLAYDLTFAKIAEGMSKIRPSLTLAPCYWGGAHGATLRGGGMSLPARDDARNIPSEEPSDPDVALWNLLDTDPLLELRLLATAVSSADGELPPNAVTSGQRLAGAVRALSFDHELRALLTDAHLRPVFADAVDAVLSSEPYLEASASGATHGQLMQAVARAVVAESMLRVERELGSALPVDGRQRDDLVFTMISRLGNSERSVGTAVGRLLVWAASHAGLAKPFERRRDVITAAVAPVTGDVLMYLARGQAIRQFIEQTVTAVADPPVVLLAHSLGGVACLETLVTKPLPEVRQLITVGSQGPLLYELDALPTVEFGQELPKHVPPWLNIIDRRDLLAFAGSGLFPGRVRDRFIDNRVGFPRAHSAYFGNREFYAVLDEVLP